MSMSGYVYTSSDQEFNGNAVYWVAEGGFVYAVIEDPGVGVKVYKFNAKQLLGTKGPKYLPQVENAISVTKIVVETINEAVNIYDYHGNVVDFGKLIKSVNEKEVEQMIRWYVLEDGSIVIGDTIYVQSGNPRRFNDTIPFLRNSYLPRNLLKK